MRKTPAAMATTQVELLQEAREVLGDRLTAVILSGERRPRLDAVGELSTQSEADREALRVALEIANELLQFEARATVQAWFVGKNRMLGDRAPALVVRTDPEAVREAARQFAAYG